MSKSEATDWEYLYQRKYKQNVKFFHMLTTQEDRHNEQIEQLEKLLKNRDNGYHSSSCLLYHNTDMDNDDICDCGHDEVDDYFLEKEREEDV